MQYQATGKIIKVGSIIPCTGKVREKITFIIRDEDDDNREIAFLLFDEKIHLYLDPLEIGDKVKVSFTIKSREFINKGINTGDYSTNCFALSIEKIEEQKKERRERKSHSRDEKYNDSFRDWFRKKTEESTRQQYPHDPPPWENQQSSSHSDWFIGCKNAQEAKKRYRELSKKWHPDMSGGDKTIFQAINNQYERWK